MIPSSSNTGIYYAKNESSGEGDGSSPENAKAFKDLISGTLVAYDPDGCPRIYVLDDITNDTTSYYGISYNVKIIGAKDGVIGEKPTIKSTKVSYTFWLSGSNNFSFQGVILDAGEKGFVLNCRSGNLTVVDCSIQNGTITQTGSGYSGAGICFLGNNLEVSYTDFTNCIARRDGGAIYYNVNNTGEPTANVTWCKIYNCTARSHGGGLFIETCGDASVEHCKIIN